MALNEKDPIDPQDHSRLLVELHVRLHRIEGRMKLMTWMLGALFLAWAIDVLEEAGIWPF